MCFEVDILAMKSTRHSISHMDLVAYVLLLNLFLDHLQWFRKSQEDLETANPVTQI